MNKVEKFIKYAQHRDVIFVLGAGASKPDGVPLQRDILPQILSDENQEIKKSEIGKIVIDFINDNFMYNSQLNLYPKLEAVFGFLDYFIQHNESLNSKYTNSRIREIKEYLIKLVHYIVNLNTDKKSHYYQQFWQILTNKVPNSSIITLNYDTLLEQSFEFLFKKNYYLDYCIPLMNYEKLPQLKNYNFWINPREPVFVEESAKPISIKIIKLHGSLNWKYCNCCNLTLLTPWDRKIDLNKGKFLGYTYPDKEEYEFRCPIDETDFETLIMPPSYLKTLHHPVISQLLVEASKEIRSTRKIIFIGYSMSDADLHIIALFKKHIQEGTKVIVVNPKKKESLELSYKSISKEVKFINTSFEELLEKNLLLEIL
ncbi:MAG: SIR2 family protein [Melioribacter sp.]|nr:SIR2 family protein [Melioribacter sp.]